MIYYEYLEAYIRILNERISALDKQSWSNLLGKRITFTSNCEIIEGDIVETGVNPAKPFIVIQTDKGIKYTIDLLVTPVSSVKK